MILIVLPPGHGKVSLHDESLRVYDYKRLLAEADMNHIHPVLRHNGNTEVDGEHYKTVYRALEMCFLRETDIVLVPCYELVDVSGCELAAAFALDRERDATTLPCRYLAVNEVIQWRDAAIERGAIQKSTLKSISRVTQSLVEFIRRNS
jgi:hypothetical protein